jgi:hypothetical protein
MLIASASLFDNRTLTVNLFVFTSLTVLVAFVGCLPRLRRNPVLFRRLRVIALLFNVITCLLLVVMFLIDYFRDHSTGSLLFLLYISAMALWQLIVIVRFFRRR